MRYGSLFSGLGGFDLAAQWCDWENVFQCENSGFCQAFLRYFFRNTELYGDIKQTDFKKYRGTVDIVSGGFPCQPFSLNGKRKGTDDDRYLWPEMFRAIREIRSSWVVAENVYGLLSQQRGMVFEQVCADLENEGYEVQPFIVPACAVDAPHRRDRIWIVAYSHSNAAGRYRHGETGSPNGKTKSERTVSGNGQSFGFGAEGITADADKYNGNLSGFNSGKIPQFKTPGIRIDTNATSGRRIQNDEIQQAGQPEQNIPNWRDFPTQSPVCSRNDGFSAGLGGITFPRWRSESIKALGNAIVPPLAYEIFKIIDYLNKLEL
jgi:DNA (cytosine-5)-methyltransferase 1